MRRRWTVVALCLAAIAVGGVLSFDYVQRRQVAKRTACRGSLNRIRLTKLVYADEHGVTNGAAIPGEVIWRENRLIERCFSGGHYSINPVANGRAAPPDKTSKVHLVSKIVGKDFLSETIRIGDLNGDGARDVLFVQNLYGPRIITCLTATTPAGEILWQTGTPSKENGRAYCAGEVLDELREEFHQGVGKDLLASIS